MTNGSGDHGGSAESHEAKKDESSKDQKAIPGPKEAPQAQPKSK
jgi:hypothetical protein